MRVTIAVRRWWGAVAVLVAVLSVTAPAQAMSVEVVGDQIIMSGASNPGDFERFQTALDGAKEPITTVIFREGPGGDSTSASRIGTVIRERRLRTAVSGMCWSACYFAFLGGVERHFTDELPANRTYLAFHGQSDINNNVGGKIGLALRWILDHTDGKADPALFERMKELDQAGAIKFLHPDFVGNPERTSVFLCRGYEHRTFYEECEHILGTNALKQGVITSTLLVHVNGTAEGAWGTRVDVAGDQIILSGAVRRGADEVLLRRLDESGGAIRTLIVRNSEGGDIETGQRIGAIVHKYGLRTALSGYCTLACAYAFLSGVERRMTDEIRAADTFLVLRDEYADGLVQPAARAKWKRWVLELTGRRADPALLDRMQDIRTPRGGIYFYDAERPVPVNGGATMWLCRGDEPKRVRDCERLLSTNAYAQGIFTSKELVKVNRVPAPSDSRK